MICGFPITVNYKGFNLCLNHVEASKVMEEGVKNVTWYSLLKDRGFINWWTVTANRGGR